MPKFGRFVLVSLEYGKWDNIIRSNYYNHDFWPFLYENLVVKKDSAGDNTGMMGIFDDVVSFTIPTFALNHGSSLSARRLDIET